MFAKGMTLPPQIQALPRNEDGWPVPWFVATVDGKPDFRVMDAAKRMAAIQNSLCWVCGRPLTDGFGVFVIGPMCAVNRTSAEPPSHEDCAEFSAVVCPFLSEPKRGRNEYQVPEGTKSPGGHMLKRNPGVTLLWKTGSYSTVPDGMGGFVLEIGDPIGVSWYCQGRVATRAEVVASIESGLPALEAIAKTDPEPGALQHLAACVQRALPLLPVA